MGNSVINLGDADIVQVTEEQICHLRDLALSSPLRRARYCLHRNLDDGVHEMVIALARDGYIRPHRHQNKTESFHILEGRLEVIFFDDNGIVIARVRLDAEGAWGGRIYRMNSALWHGIIVHSEVAVIHETTSGPFVKDDCDFAGWAPDDTSTIEQKAFIRRLS